jgi:dTDP-4-amino-4,6-dideoxygalactose transaminase
MHLQECFTYLGHTAGAFPESERAAKETLALPIYPELTESQAEYVVESVRGFFDEATRVLAGARPHGVMESIS